MPQSPFLSNANDFLNRLADRFKRGYQPYALIRGCLLRQLDQPIQAYLHSVMVLFHAAVTARRQQNYDRLDRHSFYGKGATQRAITCFDAVGS